MSKIMNIRSKSKVFLVNSVLTEMTGNKLPSIGMSLRFFLYHHNDLKATVREASKITTAEISKFWMKARIPMRDPQHCQKKLEKLFEEWRLLKKNQGRKTPNQKAKEHAFSSKLDNLFDVAHADALNIIKIAEDRDFLLAQRKDGRQGSMIGVDKNLLRKESIADEKKNLLKKRLEKMKSSQEMKTEVAVLESSTTEDSNEDEEDEEYHHEVITSTVSEPGPSKAKRGRMEIITPKLATVLDRTKVSDRKAVFEVAETAKSLGCDINEVSLNRSTIRRKRMSNRIKESQKLKESLQRNVPLIVHWDGKLLPELTGGKDKIDKLAIIVSGKGVSQMLAVAKLPSATGEAQAQAIVNALNEWDIADQVIGMSFDTTSANSGKDKGACVLLEEKLEKKLFYFACRHHVMELIIGKVFNISLQISSSSPDVPLFKRFQGYWEFIDRDKFETGLIDDKIKDLLYDIKDEILKYAIKQETLLTPSKPRDDYLEFIELIIIFLGGIPIRGIRFMQPGAMHHARWMSKVIYSLKLFIFRSQFKLTKMEYRGLSNVCIFIIRIYFKAWVTASVTETSPYNDFELMNNLLKYSRIHEKIAKSASEKFSKHLWYLSEDLSGLSLFDSHVPLSTKRKLVEALQNKKGTKNPKKRIDVSLENFHEKKFEDFVNENSMKLFKEMNLSLQFLTVDPEHWNSNPNYKDALELVKSIQVVNDHAERGIALIKEYTGILTKDEPQFQLLTRVVEEHRKAYPCSRKKDLTN